jgi:DNA polymerase I-like protein with 3'-5' exonuclease and polymerase domains
MLTKRDGSNTDWANMPLDEMAKGNSLDAYYTLNLFFILEQKLKENNLYEHYDKLTSKLIPVFAEIELKGMIVNTNTLGTIAPKMQEKIVKVKEELKQGFSEIRPEDNLASNPTLVEILYTRENGFGLYPPFRSKKTGEPQVNKDAFEVLESLIEEELERRA